MYNSIRKLFSPQIIQFVNGDYAILERNIFFIKLYRDLRDTQFSHKTTSKYYKDCITTDLNIVLKVFDEIHIRPLKEKQGREKYNVIMSVIDVKKKETEQK